MSWELVALPLLWHTSHRDTYASAVHDERGNRSSVWEILDYRHCSKFMLPVPDVGKQGTSSTNGGIT